MTLRLDRVSATRPIFSTLVDAKPKYEAQGLLWAWSLLSTGVPSEDVVIHHTPSLSPGFRAAIAEFGVPTREVPSHASGIAHCNKVQQLRYGAWPRGSLVVLCDSDIVWLDPHGLPRVGLAANVVDRPRPPESIWSPLLQEAGLSAVMVPAEYPLRPGEQTPSTNLNGGLYLIDAGLARDLGAAWDERVAWLVGRRALLEGWPGPDAPGWPQKHAVDQVAMALALLDLQVAPTHLHRGWNFPTHLDPGLLRRPVVHIRALHHHDRRDELGRLLTAGVDWIDAAIGRANEIVDSMRAYCAGIAELGG